MWFNVTMKPSLLTERVSIDTLRPHPKNARNGDTDAIMQSLDANGQYRAIVVSKDGTILAGNHTYAAALELGWDLIDVHRLDIEPDSDHATRIMLADNRTADLGKYDEGLLLDLLSQLDASASLQGSGYEARDLEALLHLLRAPDLDDLARAIGDPTSEDGLRRVVLNLSPDLAAITGAALSQGAHDDIVRGWLGIE